MVRIVCADSLKTSGNKEILEETSVIRAVSIAISEPKPIATDPSAVAKASASLMPSSAIATTFPSCCNFLTSSAFPKGDR